jgi:hypothetical protein
MRDDLARARTGVGAVGSDRAHSAQAQDAQPLWAWTRAVKSVWVPQAWSFPITDAGSWIAFPPPCASCRKL